MRFFAFDSVTGSHAEIVATRLENSGGYKHWRLSPDGYYNWSLSPDGKYLASARQRFNDGAEIRILSITDSLTRTLTVPNSVGIEGVDWAADGKSLWLSVEKSPLTGFGSDDGWAVYNVDLIGKITDSLENDAVWFSQAIPSPNGRRVAITGEALNSNVWLLENF